MGRHASWTESFIAVDWGSTNRRGYRVDAGHFAQEFADDRGIIAIEPGGFDAAVEEVRDRLGHWPILLAGMIGSNRGWVETPYLPCPAGIDDLASGLVRVGDDIRIVPGVAVQGERCDVMRGEEIQVLGALEAGTIPGDCLVCHPGTHNKWIRVAGKRIQSFRTVMTGELFNLLKEKSLLSGLLAGQAMVGDSFREGIGRGLAGDSLGANLFEARARFLLGRLDQADGPSFISGLLLGDDVRCGLGDSGGLPVVVMGRPDLTALYAAAIECAGERCEQVDGEGAFLAGANAIVERIQ